MNQLNEKYVAVLDYSGYDCERCGEPFGTTDDPDVKGDWDCVVGLDGLLYHDGCYEEIE